MKNPGIEQLSADELEKFLIIGMVQSYSDLAEYDYLVNYYILTGEVPDDYESARKFLATHNCDLTDTVV